MTTIRAALQPPYPQSPGSLTHLATPELLDEVVVGGYTGAAWEELARRFVARALPALERAITGGTIYHRCRRAGFGIRHRQELQVLAVAQEIAAEAIDECLARFQEVVLPRGDWDPDRGGTLEDFFTGCCLPHVANRWRWHLRQLPPGAIELDALDEVGQAGVLVAMSDPPPGPAHVVEVRDAVARALAPMSRDDRTAFVLRSQGWSGAEIAQLLGTERNTLDARMSRARRAARARRMW